MMKKALESYLSVLLNAIFNDQGILVKKINVNHEIFHEISGEQQEDYF
jgi:hypothetical protein